MQLSTETIKKLKLFSSQPKISKGSKFWEEEEDVKLLKLVESFRDHLIKWEEIAVIIRKTKFQCFLRYKQLISKENNSTFIFDDLKLLELIKQYGQNWKIISEKLNVSKEFLKNHYKMLKSKEIPLSEEETLKVVENYRLHNGNLQEISKIMGLSIEKVKNSIKGLLSHHDKCIYYIYNNKALPEESSKFSSMKISTSIDEFKDSSLDVFNTDNYGTNHKTNPLDCDSILMGNKEKTTILYNNFQNETSSNNNTSSLIVDSIMRSNLDIISK
jgi:hypothetical protein